MTLKDKEPWRLDSSMFGGLFENTDRKFSRFLFRILQNTILKTVEMSDFRFVYNGKVLKELHDDFCLFALDRLFGQYRVLKVEDKNDKIYIYVEGDKEYDGIQYESDV